MDVRLRSMRKSFYKTNMLLILAFTVHVLTIQVINIEIYHEKCI